MEYKGKIVYDIYTITGNYKLNVAYDVEGFGEDFEITRIAISVHESIVDSISFDLEDEMEDIIEECIKDFASKKEFLSASSSSKIKADMVAITDFIRANDKYDFSAN